MHVRSFFQKSKKAQRDEIYAKHGICGRFVYAHAELWFYIVIILGKENNKINQLAADWSSCIYYSFNNGLWAMGSLRKSFRFLFQLSQQKGIFFDANNGVAVDLVLCAEKMGEKNELIYKICTDLTGADWSKIENRKWKYFSWEMNIWKNHWGKAIVKNHGQCMNKWKTWKIAISNAVSHGLDATCILYNCNVHCSCI